MQQWAWLNTRAKSQSNSRIQNLDVSTDTIAERFPDVEPFVYLIELLSRIGVAINNGTGVQGITWQEIDAFVSRTQINLNSWEAETLKRLSAVYASSVLKYDNQDAPAPYRSIKEQTRIASSMKSVLRQVVVKDKHGLSNDSNQSRYPRSKGG